MITKKNIDKYLNKGNLRYFNTEDEYSQKLILHALNRKPITRPLKNGMHMHAEYKYDAGNLALDMKLMSGNKVIWKDWYESADLALSLDGDEPRSWIIEQFVESFIFSITIGDSEKGIRILKRILF